ncbi:MAG: transposase, partial [Kiloniellaceae bacterium]
MSRTATIASSPQALAAIEEMPAEGYAWGKDDRLAGRGVSAEIPEGRMVEAIDRHLEETAWRGAADRRNGYDIRHLLTGLGLIELHVPRTRRFNPVAMVQ